jgi:hypothetical protein
LICSAIVCILVLRPASLQVDLSAGFRADTPLIL